MATTKQQENMLLTEHFTWPPISLIDDIINMINEVLYRCTTILDSELSSLDPSILGFSDRALAEKHTPETDEQGNPIFPEAKLEVEEGVLKLETLVENAVDKNFDKLEIWTLRNVLCLVRDRKGGEAEGEDDLAKWVRLAHYGDVSAPSPDNALSPSALQSLRRKLQETQKLHAALLAEKTRNEAQISRLRSLLQPPPKLEPRSSTSSNPQLEGPDVEAPFAFLTHAPVAQSVGIQTLPTLNNSTTPTTAGEGRTPLTTHTSFNTSQLPHLRALLAQLKPHLASTSLHSTSHISNARQNHTKERQEYIESQSKRILEKRGVDTRDGVEGSMEGTRVRSEEVRGLEGLVAGWGKKETGVGGDGEEMDTS